MTFSFVNDILDQGVRMANLVQLNARYLTLVFCNTGLQFTREVVLGMQRVVPYPPTSESHLYSNPFCNTAKKEKKSC